MRRPTEPARHVRLRQEKLRKYPGRYDRPAPGLVRTTQWHSVWGRQPSCPACDSCTLKKDDDEFSWRSHLIFQIGRASCRERVCQDDYSSEVDDTLKKNKNKIQN